MHPLALAATALLVLVLAGALARGRARCGCGPSCSCAQAGASDGPALGAAPQEPVRLRLRALWREHVSRTRAFTVSALGGLADTKAVSDHLLDNQKDIGALFAEKFGPATGGAVTALLQDHILIASELVAAVKNGQPTGAISVRWDQNADELGSALQRLRPTWGEARGMLRKHLEGTSAYLMAHLRGDYESELRLVDAAQVHMARFADLLAARWDG